MNDFVDEIYKTIEAMIQRYVSKMKISQQENGVVIGESKKGSHRYMVKVKEAIYDVKDGIGLSPAPNTSVWVTVPNGDWNLAYICAGRNAETGYVTEEELKSTRAALETDIQEVYDACVSGGAVINPTNLEKVIKAGINITFTETADTLTINASSSITDVILDGTSVVSEGVAILESGDFGKIKDVTVNGSSVVDQTGTAVITIPPSPTIPVTDVKVDNVSVLDGTVAKLSKNDLNIIKDVKVNGGTVVNPAGIANISITNVVANPSGTGSTDLTKLQVGNNIYNIPQGGGTGNVEDVYVNGNSVLDSNHIAQIYLTDYATDTELQNAINTLQSNFQDGVDSIYDACVAKGSTPISHSLSDVIDAIYAIGGTVQHANIESTNNIAIRFNSSITEEEE